MVRAGSVDSCPALTPTCPQGLLRVSSLLGLSLSSFLRDGHGHAAALLSWWHCFLSAPAANPFLIHHCQCRGPAFPMSSVSEHQHHPPTGPGVEAPDGQLKKEPCVPQAEPMPARSQGHSADSVNIPKAELLGREACGQHENARFGGSFQPPFFLICRYLQARGPAGPGSVLYSGSQRVKPDVRWAVLSSEGLSRGRLSWGKLSRGRLSFRLSQVMGRIHVLFLRLSGLGPQLLETPAFPAHGPLQGQFTPGDWLQGASHTGQLGGGLA